MVATRAVELHVLQSRRLARRRECFPCVDFSGKRLVSATTLSMSAIDLYVRTIGLPVRSIGLSVRAIGLSIRVIVLSVRAIVL